MSEKGFYFRLAHLIAGPSLVLMIVPIYGQFSLMAEKSSHEKSKVIFTILGAICYSGPIGGGVFMLHVV